MLVHVRGNGGEDVVVGGVGGHVVGHVGEEERLCAVGVQGRHSRGTAHALADAHDSWGDVQVKF